MPTDPSVQAPSPPSLAAGLPPEKRYQLARKGREEARLLHSEAVTHCGQFLRKLRHMGLGNFLGGSDWRKLVVAVQARVVPPRDSCRAIETAAASRKDSAAGDCRCGWCVGSEGADGEGAGGGGVRGREFEAAAVLAAAGWRLGSLASV
jgi:hypothetical protein